MVKEPFLQNRRICSVKWEKNSIQNYWKKNFKLNFKSYEKNHLNLYTFRFTLSFSKLIRLLWGSTTKASKESSVKSAMLKRSFSSINERFLLREVVLLAIVSVKPSLIEKIILFFKIFCLICEFLNFSS